MIKSLKGVFPIISMYQNEDEIVIFIFLVQKPSHASRIANANQTDFSFHYDGNRYYNQKKKKTQNTGRRIYPDHLFSYYEPMWKKYLYNILPFYQYQPGFQNQSNAVFVVFLCLKLLAANKQQIWFKDKI